MRYRIPFLCAAGVWTDDGRRFSTVSWRNLPLPLALQTDSQHAGITASSDEVGQIIALEQDANGTVTAIVEVDPRDDNGRAIHPEGQRACQKIEAGGQGVSIDGLFPIAATITEECVQEDEDGWCLAMLVTFSEVVIGGATLCPIPAFSAAIVDPTPLGEDNQPLTEDVLPYGLVASAASAVVPSLLARAGYALTAAAAVDLAGWAPNPEHFVQPSELSLDANHINLDGDRIWGFIAPDSCHISFPAQCVRAADQSLDLSRFLRNTLPGTDVPVGFLTMGKGHANGRANATAAAEHYDDTNAVVAIITAGWWTGPDGGEHQWFAGSVKPTLNEWDRTVLATAQASGDWRSVYGEPLRMEVGALVVNTPGFQLPREPLVPLAASAEPAARCGCGGGEGEASARPDAPLTAAQVTALARVADERILAELDADLQET